MTASAAHMGPANASVRFISELVALYGIVVGVWEWTGSPALTIVAPAVAMVGWGVFRVPGDPGPAPVAVPGAVRLLIEVVVFGGGVTGLWLAHGSTVGVVFLVMMVVHYATTPARLRHVMSSPGDPDHSSHR